LITITGTNFGATQGGSVVRFLRDLSAAPPNDYVNADHIDSWSATQVVCNVPERASTGTVNVIVGGDPGVGKTFNVTFGASSTTWGYLAEPMGEDIRINSANNDVPAADALDAVIKGLQEWNGASGAEFSFTYAGATGFCSSAMNDVNEICFGSTGGSLATNYSWFAGSNLLENNIIFNDTGFTWSVDLSVSTYDIQSVATHELGHSLRLLDLYGNPGDVGKTMYGRTDMATSWHRTIEADDKAGVQFLYGPQQVNISTRDLPDATTPTFYSESIATDVGSPPFFFALRSGTSLPPNLSLSTDGTVSGFCEEDGTFYFTVRCTDGPEKDSQVIRLHIESSAAVALERFSARPVEDGVLVEWNLAAESDLGEFYVHRSAGDESGRYDVLNDEPVIASGGLSKSFSYLDKDVVPGTLYFYKLETREGSEGMFFGPVSTVASGGRAVAHWLGQNRPNPFSPASDGVTVLTFSLPVAGPASVRIYDAVGRLVAVPFDGETGSGETDVLWDGKDKNGTSMPARVYFYELYAPGFQSTRKMEIAR
jgi:hypothetical protein